MAIINTLREKMGRLLVVVVGLSILAFVLTDLLGSQSSILGTNKREVGEIDGESISQEQYAALVENLKRYYGVPSTNDGTMKFLRDQAWQQLISDISFSKKLDELGLEISTNERVDMVQGKNLAPVMQQFFMQYLGTTDVNSIKGFLQSIQFDPNMAFAFENAERQAIISRRMDKFTNLITKTEYATLDQAKQAYQEQLAFLNVEYVFVPLASVSDDQVSVSDQEIRSYLSEHEDDYKVEESRSIQYVSFPVVPSAADSADYRAQMADVRTKFELGDNDSIYAMSVTEAGVGFMTYDPTALPVAVQDQLPNVKVGDILGPDLANGVYSIHKVAGVEESENEFAKLSMIAFSKAGLAPSDVAGKRTKANGVLRQLRNGGDFAQLARENSEGAYANAGGNMGWVSKTDANVAEFADAAFARTRSGLITRLIETDNNIYIIKVDVAKTNKRYKIAQVILEMVPSFETTNAAYIEAAEFASSAYGSEEFNSVAAENGFAVFSGNNIDKNAASVGRLTSARQVVSWLYGEASFGDVKDFELEDEYVVAVFSGESPEGVRAFEDVKTEIEGILRNEKKAQIIKDKMAGLSGDASAVAASYGAEAQIYTNTALKLADNTLANVGTAPEAIGAAFALQNAGDWTAPYIVNDRGVVMVHMKSKSDAVDIGNYALYENQIVTDAVARANGKLSQSVIDKVEVIDFRYKYY